MKDKMQKEEKIEIGISARAIYLVKDIHSANHIGSGSLRVLSTPSVIAFLEITARKMLDDLLPNTHTTVGTHVDIHHMAAVQIGAEVEARVVVSARDRKQITLSIDLFHGNAHLASGKHKRFIIDKRKFQKKLDARAIE